MRSFFSLGLVETQMASCMTRKVGGRRYFRNSKGRFTSKQPRNSRGRYTFTVKARKAARKSRRAGRR